MRNLSGVASGLSFMLLSLTVGGCAAHKNTGTGGEQASRHRLASHIKGFQACALADGGYVNSEIHKVKELSRTEVAQIESWLSDGLVTTREPPTFSGFWLLILAKADNEEKVLKINRGNGSFWIYAVEKSGNALRLGELIERCDTIHSPQLKHWLMQQQPDSATDQIFIGGADEI